MPPAKKKGYIEDPAIRKMRAQAWFKAVSLSSGMTAAELEREFSERKTEGAKTMRSCIWDKYRRGDALPRSGRKTSGELNLVERVETKFPGTAKWLTSPLWRLLDKAPMEMSEIRQIYEEMPSMLRPLFLAPSSEATEIFWRRQIGYKETYKTLAQLGSLEALTATLAMIREATIIQDQAKYVEGITTAKKLLVNQTSHPVINTWANEKLYALLKT